jgi:hypothetical protein
LALNGTGDIRDQEGEVLLYLLVWLSNRIPATKRVKGPLLGANKTWNGAILRDCTNDFGKLPVFEEIVGAIERLCRVGRSVPISRHGVPRRAAFAFLTRYAHPICTGS